MWGFGNRAVDQSERRMSSCWWGHCERWGGVWYEHLSLPDPPVEQQLLNHKLSSLLFFFSGFFNADTFKIVWFYCRIPFSLGRCFLESLPLLSSSERRCNSKTFCPKRNNLIVQTVTTFFPNLMKVCPKCNNFLLKCNNFLSRTKQVSVKIKNFLSKM